MYRNLIQEEIDSIYNREEVDEDLKKAKKALLLTMAIMLCLSTAAIQAAADSSDYIHDRANDLYEYYQNLPSDDQKAVRQARERIREIKAAYDSDATKRSEYEKVIDPLWAKLQPKLDENSELGDSVSKEALVMIGLHIAAMSYDPNFSALDEIKKDPKLRGALNAIAKIAGVQNGVSEITKADAGHFAKELEKAIKTKIDGKKSIVEELKRFIANFNKYAETVDELKESNATAKILSYYNITLRDILDVAINVADAKTPSGETVDPGYRVLRLAAAFFIGISDRGGGSRPPVYIPPVTPPVTPPDMPVENNPLPPEFIDIILERIQAVLDWLRQHDDGVTKRAPHAKRLVSTVEGAWRELAEMTVSGDPEVKDSTAVFNLDANALIQALEENDHLRQLVMEKAANGVNNSYGFEYEWVIHVPDDSEQVRKYVVVVPAEAIKRAKAMGATRVTVIVGGGLLSVPIEHLVDAGDVSFIVELIEQVPETTISNSIRAAREMRAEDGNGNVLQPFGGRQFRVGIKLDGVGRSSSFLTMFRMNDGRLENVGGQYDSETGMFVADTNSFSVYAAADNRVHFKDGDLVSWANQAIQELGAKGVLNGRLEGGFDPLATLTRAEFATMLVQLLKVYDEDAVEPFTDVADGSWYQPYIASAYAQGLIYGKGDNLFAPNDPVTRAEMAVIISRVLQQHLPLLGKVDADANFSSYNDTDDVYEGMIEDLALAVREDIISGASDGELGPNEPANRAQAAVIIYRLYQLLY